ncbi:2-methylfumaryl-CoA isomerase [Actinacidiphila alni]|uniref:2-methylfumaryl-CoA isomerase n=1 Tax=Actinacidiphila alni TaxID=380248 RepID=A0A1I2JX74_9ACTN|nr:CoA transferase [Actinacidiphila alni]SFF58753.1 2-methylfumaryl-CoA isomerase [Actinacidiphila alni]
MSGPLADLHILDLSTYVAGPSATMTLAQLGADVVRVDPLGGATDTRRLPLGADGTSLYWAGLNKGKRSVELDLRSESGRDVVRSLLAAPGDGHGLLVTNAVGQSWLDHRELRRVRSDVIVARIGGRGDGRPAVDYTINSEVGLPWLTGPVDSARPVNHVLPAWDLLTGLHIALALLAAHRERTATGRGRLIEVGLADVAAATMAHLGFVADAVVNGPGRLRDGNYLYGSYGCDFATGDGRRVMVVALTARHWDTLVELTGTRAVLDSLQRALDTDFGDEGARYAHRDLISAVLAPWFSARTHAEAVAALDAGRVLWGDYRTLGEFVTDPLVTANDLFHQVDQPGVGVFPTPGPVARSAGWGLGEPVPAPRLGADNDTVLREWLRTESGRA